MGEVGAVPSARRLARAVRVAVVAAAVVWLVADVLAWVGPPPAGDPRVASAHALHLLGDALLAVGIWGMARLQRPRRWRGEGIEAMLVLLGIALPTWLLWVRPGFDAAAEATPGGTPVLGVHLVLLLVTAGLVVWYVVGDVRIDPQDEAIRAVLVLLVFIDLGPPVPGAGMPTALEVGLEVVRVGLAAALAVMVLFPSALAPRPPGRRHWHPDQRRVVVWAIVALIGPIVLAGGAVVGPRDMHAILVAAVGTVVGVGLLVLREWLVVQDVGQEAGRASRRADHQSRLARRLSQREQARSTFLGAAAHDLRTPLMAVRGSAELLARHGDHIPADQRASLLDSLTRNSDRLDRLLTSLLDVERLTAGQVTAHREDVDVDALVARVVALPHLREATVHVAASGARARVDPMMLERICENLLSNAVRHTPAGTPVWVTATPLTGHGLRVAVGDAGPGVPEEDRTRVLEAFARLDASADTPGTGLGLSLVAGFARLHGGGVRVREREGGGAEFVVDLPGPSSDEDTARLPVPAGGVAGRWALPDDLHMTLVSGLAASFDDEQAADHAARVLLRAQTVADVVGLLVAVVHHLGGAVADPATASPVLDADLTLGEGPPLVATATSDTVAARLQTHLPALFEDAGRMADLLRSSRRAPAGDEVLGSAAAPAAEQRDRFLAWAAQGRAAACIDLALALVRQGEDRWTVVQDLLVPVQQASGERWQATHTGVAEEHAVTSTVEATLGALDLADDRGDGRPRLAVVCAVDDPHVVPARMATLGWRGMGARVHLLGAGLEPRHVRHHLREVEVDALAVSCTLAWRLAGVHRLVAVAHELGLPVVLGGAAMRARPAWGVRLGVDLVADAPLDTVEPLTAWREDRPPLLTPPVHAELAGLRDHHDRIMRRAVAAVGGRRWGGDVGDAAEDLGILVAALGSAVQVDDAALLADVVTWMARRSTVRGVPAQEVDAVLEALAEALPEDLVHARATMDTQLGRARQRDDPGDGATATAPAGE